MNGAFYIARKSFESELWRRKPASWWKIWSYILGSVQHKDYKELKRGQGYFNFTELCRMEALGKDVTINNVEKFIKYAKRAEMLATTKATHGMLLSVCKYDQYQDTDNYKSDNKSGESSGIKAEQKRNRSGDINNNDKNDKNENKEEQPLVKIPNKLSISRSQELTFLKAFPGMTTTELREQIQACNVYMNMSSNSYTNPGLFFRGWLQKYTQDKFVKASEFVPAQKAKENLPEISEEERQRNLQRLAEMKKKLRTGVIT